MIQITLKFLSDGPNPSKQGTCVGEMSGKSLQMLARVRIIQNTEKLIISIEKFARHWIGNPSPSYLAGKNLQWRTREV